MTPKVKTPAPTPDQARECLLAGPLLSPPCTTEERLECIEALGRRIDGHIQFMRKADSLAGTSGEARERAVRACYERLLAVEAQLGRIKDELQLG